MCNMPIEGIKIEKYFCKNLGLYFTDGFGSDGSVVKGLMTQKSLFIPPWLKCSCEVSATDLLKRNYCCENVFIGKSFRQWFC